MTWILGVAASDQGAEACLMREGSLVTAVTLPKPAQPASAALKCLADAGVAPHSVAHVAVYGDPGAIRGRQLESSLWLAPAYAASFARTASRYPLGIIPRSNPIRSSFGPGFTGSFHFLSQPDCLEATAFYPSPFQQAAVLTVGSCDEWSTTRISRAEGNRLTCLQELHFPHGLDRFVATIATYLGLPSPDHWEQIPELALGGEPLFAEVLAWQFIYPKPDGSYRLNMDHFHATQWKRKCKPSLMDVLGGPQRMPGQPLLQRHRDLAASLMKVLDRIVLSLMEEAHRVTGACNLCLAGNGALLQLASKGLHRTTPFSSVHLSSLRFQAPHAQGAALLLWHGTLGAARTLTPVNDTHGPASSSPAEAGPAASSEAQAPATMPSQPRSAIAPWRRVVRSLWAGLAGLLALLFYFAILTPWGLLHRLGGTDPLGLRRVKVASFWIRRQQTPPAKPEAQSTETASEPKAGE